MRHDRPGRHDEIRLCPDEEIRDPDSRLFEYDYGGRDRNCGACRITVGGKTKFVCVDGPEFDAHQVDFDEMLMRLGAYKDIEKK